MNALVVGGAPSPGVSRVVERVAPDYDVVIAADAGASTCLSAGRIPDLVVGDFDSLDPSVLEHLRTQGVPMTFAPAEKDDTDLDLAIVAARERGVRSVTFTGVLGGRLDHTLAALGSIARTADLFPELVESGVRGYLISSAHRRELELHEPRGTLVSLMALEPAVVTCSGFRYPLDRQLLASLSSRGVSNVVTDETASIAVHEGILLVLVILEHD